MIWLILGWLLVYLLVGMVVFPLCARIIDWLTGSGPDEDDAVGGMVAWPFMVIITTIFVVIELLGYTKPLIQWVYRKIAGVK